MGMISQEVLDAKRRAVADQPMHPRARRDYATLAIEDRRVLAVEIDRLMEALLDQQDGKDKLEAEMERLREQRDLYERAWMRLSTKTQEDIRAEQRLELP